MATIQELESFDLNDAVKFHKELNPRLWDNEKLDPEVRDQLLLIAEDFVEYLGLDNLKVEDVTISGSNAAYSYTPHSDLDLHILVDFNNLPDDSVYQELFTAKKTLYNDLHDITVREVPVELYVQDTNQVHTSLGEYSVVYDKWIRIPKKRRANFDEAATKLKYEKLGDLIELALKTKDPKRVKDTIDIVKRYRKAGLERAGEFGPENLAFKAIRKQGLIQDLYDLKAQLHGEKLSIDEAASRDDALLKIKKLLNTAGRTDSEKQNIKRIVDKMMQQWNIDPNEVGIREPVDPAKAKMAKAAYAKSMPPGPIKKGVFAEDEANDKKAAVLKIQKHLNKKYGANLDLDGKLGPLTLKSINKFMPRAKTGLADEPNKTTAVQGKKVKVKEYVDDLKSYRNPSPKTLHNLTKRSAHKHMRGMYHNGNTYWWDANDAIHADGSKLLGIPYDYLNRLEAAIDNVSGNYYVGGDDGVPAEITQRYDVEALAEASERHPYPYGYWIDITGEVVPVETYNGHESAGRAIMQKYDRKTKKGKIGDSLNLFYSGAIRVVTYNYPDMEIEICEPNRKAARSMVRLLRELQPTKVYYENNCKINGPKSSGTWQEATRWVIQQASEPDYYDKLKQSAIEKQTTASLTEASGYIPSQKEKNDPRFKTALTVDVKPDSIKKNAKAFGFKTSRAGIPPQARADGKITEDRYNGFALVLPDRKLSPEEYTPFPKLLTFEEYTDTTSNSWRTYSNKVRGYLSDRGIHNNELCNRILDESLDRIKKKRVLGESHEVDYNPIEPIKPILAYIQTEAVPVTELKVGQVVDLLYVNTINYAKVLQLTTEKKRTIEKIVDKNTILVSDDSGKTLRVDTFPISDGIIERGTYIVTSNVNKILTAMMFYEDRIKESGWKVDIESTLEESLMSEWKSF